MDITSGGNLQNLVFPTTLLPRPSANNVSVVLGDKDIIRL
jgi:hypothetical protein